MKAALYCVMIASLFQIVSVQSSEIQQVTRGLGDGVNVKGLELVENTKNWFRTNACKEYFFEVGTKFETQKEIIGGCILLIDDGVFEKKDPSNQERDYDYYYNISGKSSLYRVVKANDKSENQAKPFFVKFPVDIQNKNGKTLLNTLFNASGNMLYCDYFSSRARFLIDHGASIGVQDNRGYTLVDNFCRYKEAFFSLKYSFLKFCVENNCITEEKQDGFIGFKDICSNCKYDIITYLQCCSDINSFEYNHAVKAVRTVILYILKKGCDCYFEKDTKEGLTEEFFIENSNFAKQLHKIVTRELGRKDNTNYLIIKLLVESGIDIHRQNKKGETVLNALANYCATYGCIKEERVLEIVRLLLEHGAQYKRTTCIDHFLKTDFYDVKELLLQYNNALLESQKVYIPLHYICSHYGDKEFELLKKYDAIIDCETIDRDTLSHVVEGKKINIMCYLLENKYNSVVKCGKELLYIASKNYHNYEMTKLLFEHLIDTLDPAAFIEKTIHHNDMICKIFTLQSLLRQLYNYKWYDLVDLVYQSLDAREEKSEEMNDVLFPYYLQEKMYDKIVQLDLQYGFYDENWEHVFSSYHIINRDRYDYTKYENIYDYPGYGHRDLKSSEIDWQSHYLFLLDNLITIYPDLDNEAEDLLCFYFKKFFEADGIFNPVFTFLMTEIVSQENKISFVENASRIILEKYQEYLYEQYSFGEGFEKISAIEYVQEYYPDVYECIVKNF